MNWAREASVGHPPQAWLVLAAYREALPATRLARDLAEIEAYQQAVTAGSGTTSVGEGLQAYMADRASDRHAQPPAAGRRLGLLPAARPAQLGLISEAERAELLAQAP